MKKIFKSRIFTFILGFVVAGGIGVYAASQILASDISYRDGTVESALNDLYDKANANAGTVCIRQSGTSLTVSAKYLCELGDNISRNFYVLKVGTDDVELIMERNISDTVGSNTTMTWNDATSFFDENHPGYSLKQTWLTKVKEVKLPDAQDIASAGEITGFDVTQHSDWAYFGTTYGTNNQSYTGNRSNYAWLYNYTRGCSSNGCTSGSDFYPNSDGYPFGYWTANFVTNSNNSYAWAVGRTGIINSVVATDTGPGVRPVIVLSKSQLAG